VMVVEAACTPRKAVAQAFPGRDAPALENQALGIGRTRPSSARRAFPGFPRRNLRLGLSGPYQWRRASSCTYYRGLWDPRKSTLGRGSEPQIHLTSGRQIVGIGPAEFLPRRTALHGSSRIRRFRPRMEPRESAVTTPRQSAPRRQARKARPPFRVVPAREIDPADLKTRRSISTAK
jgi:hypothetical protein